MMNVANRFKVTDTVKEIAIGLAKRPRNYILFKENVSHGGGMQGCLGGKAYKSRRDRGAVAISILQ